MKRVLLSLLAIAGIAVAKETLNLDFSKNIQEVMLEGNAIKLPGVKDGLMTVGTQGVMLPAQNLAGEKGTVLFQMCQDKPSPEKRVNRYQLTVCCGSRMRCGIYMTGGSIMYHFGDRDKQIYFKPETPYQFGETTWFAISWDGRKVRIFQDGIMLKEFKQEAQMKNVKWLALGPYNDRYSAPVPWLDDTHFKHIIVHDTALNLDEVAEICNTKLTPPWEKYPGILTVPVNKQDLNITVDGELKEAIWKNGASLPVLTQLTKEEDTFKAPAGYFSMAADNKNLYLGLHYRMLAKNAVSEGTLRTATFKPEVWGTESFEFYININDTRYRFAGNVAGGYTERRNSDKDWAGPWQYSSTLSMKIDDSRMWEAEAVIPWSSMGLDGAPKTPVTFNFARTWCLADYSGATSLAYNGMYGNKDYFLTLQFADAPTMQLIERNDPSRGKMTQKVSVHATTPGKYTYEVLLYDKKGIAAPMPVVSKTEQFAANETKEIDLDGRITTTSYSYMGFVLRKGDTIYARNMVPFTLNEVYLDVYPRFLNGRIEFDIQTELIAEKFGDCKPALSLISPSGKKVANLPVTASKMQCPFNAETAETGEYKVCISGEDGTAITETTLNFPGLGQWYHAEYPQDIILPPFTPMTKAGKSFQMWGRSYKYDNSVLPAQITTQDVNCFTAAPEIIVDGTPLPGTGCKVTSFAKHHGDFTASAGDARANVSATGWVEYDGVSYTKFKLEAKQNVKQVSLRFKMPADMVKYLHTSCGDSWGSKRTEKLKDGVNAVPFYPMVWIGKEDKGICLFTETHRTWTAPIKQAFVINKKGNEAEVIVNIFADNIKPGTIREFEFGYLATPIKPLPSNYPLNILGDDHTIMMRRPNHVPVNALTLIYTRQTLGGVYADMPWCEPKGSENLNSSIKMIEEKNIECIPYICGHFLPDEYPEVPAFRDEWKMSPEHTLDYKRDGVVHILHDLCPASSGIKFIHQKHKEMLQKYHINGFYYDFGVIGFCSNKLHGCDECYPILAQREFFRRTALITYQSGVKEPRIVLHNTDSVQPPAMTFVSHLFNGEHIRQDSSNIMHNGKDILDTYDVSMFASELGSMPFGLTNSDYQSNDVLREQFGGGKEKPELYKFRITQAFLAGCLPHNTILSQTRCHYGIIDKVVRTYEQFGVPQSKFIGYWEEPATVRGANDVYVSVYKHPTQKKALAVISHIGKAHTNRTLAITFDAKKLGFTPTQAKDMMQADDPEYKEIYDIRTKNRVPSNRAPLDLGDFGSHIDNIANGTLNMTLHWHTFAIVELK